MTTGIGSELVIVETWLDAVLKADPTLISLVNGRVYPVAPPSGAAFPFIVYQNQDDGGQDVIGVGVTRIMVNTLYTVKACAQTDNYTSLAPVAAAIDAVMTSATGGTVVNPSGYVLASRREKQLIMQETTQGRQWRYLGGVYRIHAQGS